MTRRVDTWIAWIGAVLLLFLHLDFWRVQRPELYFDWLPEELGYRLIWMLAAWGYMVFFCARVWREED